MADTPKPPTDKDDRPTEIGRLDRRVRRLNQGLNSVYKTTALLTSPMDLQQILDTVVKTIVQALGVDAAGLRLLEENTGELVLKATFGLSLAYKNKGPVTAGESRLNMTALSGQAVIVQDMLIDDYFRRYHRQIKREGLVSCLSIGLQYHDKGIGILRLYSKRQRTFSPDDISLAQTVAQQSAVAIVNARLYAEAIEGERVARQVRLAGQVQRRLIPQKPPSLPGLDLAGVYVPCYDVGGDFYDYITLPDGRLALAIGDIMGKGIPASLAMASLRSSLRAFAQDIASLEKLITRVNDMFCHDIAFGGFATLFCGIINREHTQMEYCNCGHNPPIILRHGEHTELSAGGTILGIDKDYRYQTATCSLQRGDMLLMYTDGLPDAANFENESFGRERVIEALVASADMTAENAAKNILWLMRKFAGLTARCDDTAIVVLRKTD